jgi:glycosyltransferase involved in cell wall biosynthesis
VSRPVVLFDLTRLLGASGRSAPTGIERVEYAYARWLLAQRRVHVRFVVTMNRALRLVADGEVPAFLARQAETWAEGAQGFSAAKAIENVNDFLSGGPGPRPPRLGHLSREERLQRRQSASLAAPGGTRRAFSWAQQMAASWAREPLGPMLQRWSRKRPVVYLRASLDGLERTEPIERLKAAADVKMIVLCHDIIPFDFPEFVRPAARKQFEERLKTLSRSADGIIASSHYSAERLSGALWPRRPKMTVAHIGMDPPPPDPGGDLPALADVPFFLVISTIEARKNHHLLLNVWRRIVEERGSAAPRLVIAGKRGWEAQAPIAMLDRADVLRGHVYEAGPVPDAALDLLRRRARAVLMPSFVEGFGMPVTEALAVDTPVIASDIPVFREIATGSAELIDPIDGPAWQRAILEYAEPGSARLAAARDRACRFEPARWDAYFRSVEAFIAEVIGTDRPAARAAGEASPAPELRPVPSGLI